MQRHAYIHSNFIFKDIFIFRDIFMFRDMLIFRDIFWMGVAVGVNICRSRRFIHYAGKRKKSKKFPERSSKHNLTFIKVIQIKC